MMWKVLICLFLFSSVTPAFGKNMVDAWLDFWHATIKGNIGDTGNQSNIDFKNNNYQVGLRVYEGKSISNLIFTRYDMSANNLTPISFKGNLFSNYKLKGYRTDFQIRNMLFEDAKTCFRWIYGISHMAHKHELTASLTTLDQRGIYEPGAWMPIVGLEGNWYLHSSLTLKASMLYSEYNIRKDDVRLKDFDAGIFYGSNADIELGVGYRKSFYDMKREADVGFNYHIAGPYIQMNWMF